MRCSTLLVMACCGAAAFTTPVQRGRRCKTVPWRAPPARAASLEGLEDRLQEAEQYEADVLTAMSSDIAGFRQFIFDLIPRVDLPMFAPSLTMGKAVGTTRELLRELLQEERALSVFILATVMLVAVVC